MLKFDQYKAETKLHSYNDFIRGLVKEKWPTDAEKEWWFTKLSAVRRQKLLRCSESQNHHCCYCGVKTWHPSFGESGSKKTLATLEHVQCRTHGGTDSLFNLTMACNSCNSLRADHDAEWFHNIVQMTEDDQSDFPKSIHARLRLARGLTPMVERQMNEEKQAKQAERQATATLALALLLMLDPQASDKVDAILMEETLPLAA